jgi:cytoskeletal protein RodZ
MTVGQTVARARAEAGLSVAQVAGSTRVRATLIENIEKDDFRLCGGDVYAKGHLKTIATAVGLDPVELATAFDRQQGKVAQVRAEETVAAPAPVRATSSGLAGTLGAQMGAQRVGPNWSAAMALALALVVGVGVISFLANRPSSSSTVAGSPTPSPSVSQSATRPTTPTSTPSSSASVEPTVSPSSTDVLAQADGVVVKLTVTGARSWVRATNGSGGKTLYEGILGGGETKTFRDKNQVSLVIGNAGAVSLVVNGKDLGNPGSGGQVIKLKFGPGDPTTSAG